MCPHVVCDQSGRGWEVEEEEERRGGLEMSSRPDGRVWTASLWSQRLQKTLYEKESVEEWYVASMRVGRRMQYCMWARVEVGCE